ncbi:MAG: FKBP-type peptidyl-prolyl cis-trans isomerase [Candidatus Micrarchaeia archaeon]
MALKEGDFVKIDYSIWRGSDNTLVMTTEKKLAEENKIYDKEFRYEPRLVILEKDNMIKGVVEALKGMSVGEKKKIEISPEKAFGERMQELVRVLPISDFRKRDMTPYPGMQIEIDGGVATIMSVNSGRVMVDSNHPLAGEKITCEIKVLEKLDGVEKQSECIFEQYGLKPTKIQMNNKELIATFGKDVKKDGRYFVDKSSAVETIISNINSIEKVLVQEEYTKEQESKK